MSRFGTLVRRVDERGRGVDLPLMSVSQTLGVVRRSVLTKDPPRADSLDDYKICRAGDIVFNKMSIRDGAMGVVPEDGLVTYHYEVMRPQPGADPRYVVYLMKSEWFTGELIQRERGIGVGGTSGVRTTEVPFSVLRTIDAPTPEATAQRAIADYLDTETALINKMVLARRRMIDLLLERRSAFISIAVDSGQSTRVRRVISMCTSGPRGWGDLVTDAGSMFIRSANLTRGSIRIVNDGMAYVPPQTSPEATRSRVHDGDVLVAITGANTGWVGIADAAHEGAFVSQHVAILRPANIDPEWLAYSLASDRGQRALLGSQYGGTKTQLGLDDLRELEIRVPARDTQKAALSAVRHAEVTTQGTVSVTQRQIQLLLERRQALTTAAVTGQIQIPGVAG